MLLSAPVLVVSNAFGISVTNAISPFGDCAPFIETTHRHLANRGHRITAYYRDLAPAIRFEDR